MGFIIKFSSAVVIVFVLYMLGIFFLPSQTDSLADKLGIKEFNDSVRGIKSGADTVGDDLLQIKEDQGAVDMARNAIKSTQDSINKVKESVDKTQLVVENKINQVNKVVESGKKVINSANELKNNVNNLTSGSGTPK